MNARRLTIYGNWSAYDELSDGVILTEDLAMKQMRELLRLRSCGVRFDAYLMDAFWFDPKGGYRAWRKPNWPEGPQFWLDACAGNGLIAGLWFTANTLCHLEAADAWKDSADEDGWGLCCFEGGFLADYLDVLEYWYEQGIRLFKIDFAEFGAAPPHVKAQLSAEEIRRRNADAYREALLGFKSRHGDAIFMAFNGFERTPFMDRTDQFPTDVIDLRWLEVFDSIYSGDPRPADVPAVPFWRSVDIYGDHTTRVLANSGVPLERIDNCGFMAGPTGTCYYRGKACWKGLLLLTYARGGDLTVLYGDLSLFDLQDAGWFARAQQLFERAYELGRTCAVGGVPGEGGCYGWLIGDSLGLYVNAGPGNAEVSLPSGSWKLLFCDAGLSPVIRESALTLGPWQMALVGSGELAEDKWVLGVQADCIIESLTSLEYKVVASSKAHIEAEIAAPLGGVRVVAQQRDTNGKLVRTFAGGPPNGASAATVLRIGATQNGRPFDATVHHDHVIWSGLSWAAIDFDGAASGSILVSATSADQLVETIDLCVWTLV